MTEGEWHTCTDPRRMEAFLRKRVSARKTRLYFAAGARVVAGMSGAPPSLILIDAVERYADGQLSGPEISEMFRGQPGDFANNRSLSDNWPRLRAAIRSAADRDTPEGIRCRLADLWREVIGDPLRSVAVDPAWMKQGDAPVLLIGRHIYSERRLADLPILADALEESGCDSPEILEHLRAPGPHCRGCWALDLLLGKQ